MNYDEMLSQNNPLLSKGTLLPIGFYHKKQVNGKYCNVVDLRKHLSENILFLEDVKKECDANPAISSPYQLHFEIGKITNGEVCSLRVENGRYISFSSLLFETPSLVGRKNFVETVVEQLLEAAIYINKKGVYHLCYSPDNVFARMGDNKLMLLSHGSYYLNLSDQKSLYGDMLPYVAPEVSEGGSVDDRSEVYAIGKFIEWLFSSSDLPYEYKRLVKKATEAIPEDRYNSVEAMRESLTRLKAARRSFLTTVAALVAALFIVGVYFGLTPEQNDMEYVKPAPRQSTDDLLDDGFDPLTELGVISGDSFVRMPPEKRKQMEEYEKKNEEIFRKKFEREADRVLSKIYDAEHMGASEKNFMAASKQTFSELSEIQAKLGAEANLNPTKSQLIATQIIEKVTEQKKKTTTKNGIQK